MATKIINQTSKGLKFKLSMKLTGILNKNCSFLCSGTLSPLLAKNNTTTSLVFALSLPLIISFRACASIDLKSGIWFSTSEYNSLRSEKVIS